LKLQEKINGHHLPFLQIFANIFTTNTTNK